jgi:hypothetical protein
VAEHLDADRGELAPIECADEDAHLGAPRSPTSTRATRTRCRTPIAASLPLLALDAAPGCMEGVAAWMQKHRHPPRSGALLRKGRPSRETEGTTGPPRRVASPDGSKRGRRWRAVAPRAQSGAAGGASGTAAPPRAVPPPNRRRARPFSPLSTRTNSAARPRSGAAEGAERHPFRSAAGSITSASLDRADSLRDSKKKKPSVRPSIPRAPREDTSMPTLTPNVPVRRRSAQPPRSPDELTIRFRGRALRLAMLLAAVIVAAIVRAALR